MKLSASMVEIISIMIVDLSQSTLPLNKSAPFTLTQSELCDDDY